ncbi:hypothetical protein P8605_34670 [Streptomyces sp. T-3]|nr:hypothetical protein [Streptomyces sp. T-3]
MAESERYTLLPYVGGPLDGRSMLCAGLDGIDEHQLDCPEHGGSYEPFDKWGEGLQLRWFTYAPFAEQAIP